MALIRSLRSSKLSKTLSRSFGSEATERRVVVTGLGAVTPLGSNVQNSWDRLLKGGCAITQLAGDEYKNLPSKVAARVNRDELSIDKHFTKSDLKSMSTATLFLLMSAKEALESAGLQPLPTNILDRVGVCAGMGMFDLSDVYESYKSLSKSYNRVSPYFIPRILPNMGSGQISMKYGIRGPNHSVSTACATGAHAIGDAFRFIKHNDADVMLCGGGEACIDPLVIAGFCRLRALSTSYNENPEKSSRPFDTNRDGFVIGEGATIVVLEELNHALNRNATIYAEILGYGLSGDAHHLTSPSADGAGARLAMQRAITEANVPPAEISYVNAHATSTPVGDLIEAKAIQNIFENNTLLVSSTKGAHGHLLGASGNLETLFTILACKEGLIPPSINVDNLEKDITFVVPNSATNWSSGNKRIALKNSFGFGGTNACLCLSNFTN